MEGITCEQILKDLQAAIDANPHGRQRTEIEARVLKYLEVASEEGLGGITSRQLAEAIKESRDWTSRVLVRLESEGLVKHKPDGKVYIWHIVCNENDQ